MLIENPEAFKIWLTAVLEPLCDAEPAALAKYVYALVKKDKPIQDLRDGMVDQLDVFLQSETKPFVELLFKSLESLEYLKNIPGVPAEVKQATSPSAVEKRSVEEHAPKALSLENPRDEFNDLPRNNKKEQAPKDKDADVKSKHADNAKKDVNSKQRIVLNRTTKFVPAVVPKEKPAYATEQTLVKVIPDLLEDSLNEQLPARTNKREKKGDSDKEDRRRRRSRSRSWDRSRRQGTFRSLWRNRSPPAQQNRYERRRSRSGSPPARVPRYRNRSPPASEFDLPPNRSRSRSRERLSPVPNSVRDRPDRERDRDRQSRNRDRVDREKGDRDRERDRERERDSGTATPTQDSNPGESNTQPRGTTTLAGIFAPTQKKRCKDFDEKGYCMRGDLCQYDHGTDPLVLEEPLAHVLPLPMTRPPPRLPPPGMISEYNPLTPDIWARNSGNMYSAPPPPYFSYPPPPHGHHPVQRELIPVPIASAENMPPNSMDQSGGMPIRPPHGMGPLTPTVAANNLMAQLPPKKKAFDFNRLGMNRHIPKMAGGNCSLELKKVPRGLNDIMHLNNHFSKFGKIINIQVNYEEDPEAALITFSSHTEANVAYKSTEAVLNNRFIKVFWHNSEQSKQENVPPAPMRISAKDRLNSHNNHTSMNNNSINNVSHNKVLINKDSMKVNNMIDKSADSQKTDINSAVNEENKNGDVNNTASMEATPTSAADSTTKPELSANVELAAMVRRRGEGAAKIVKDLHRRSQLLLEKQLQQQKKLLEHLESKNITEVQKESLLQTIKAVQLSIEKTKKDLVSNPKLLASQSKKAAFGNLKKQPRSKEEAQKEILDAELDLMTKQQEGQDVTELQKRLVELKRQQLAFKPGGPTRRSSVHRAAPRGRFAKGTAPKTGIFVNQSIDHRPRSFLVSGYESDELELLMQHFGQYGEIVEHVIDSTTPSLWLLFKSRKIAEQASTKGRQFNDRTLTVTWKPKLITPPAPQAQNDKPEESSGWNFSEFIPASPTYAQKSDEDNECIAHSPYYLDSEDDEGKEYDKEEERSWKR